MKEKWHFVLYLVWFTYLVISAIILFGHGFLLSRKSLRDSTECVPLSAIGCDGRENSTATSFCTEDEKIRRILSNPGAPKVCASKRNRVVFVLVDALRYDFTEYDVTIEKPLYYQNRLPVIKETLDRYPERARVFRFIADPPTTTLQRIKALVTGSLPTFVDASSNFAALELMEDNVIDQAIKGKNRAVLLGDDTWVRLMPGRWLRSHALYSFHTWDLDTVDSEVDSKIYDELKKDDWELLVAHYLGVDHAGHRYGPNHPEMSRKLKETNSRLQKIIEMLPPDVLLYVVGDHGMTESDSQEWKDSEGDHGGESKAERTAALFAYRGAGLAGDKTEAVPGMEVQQTDLAPTMSAALGRPPPAPSLGNLLLPVLPTMTVTQTLLHLSNKLKQVMQYMIRYGEESQQVSLDRLAHLINFTRDEMDKAANIKTEAELKAYVKDVRTLIDTVRGVFREVWVEFDSLSMMRALILLLIVIFFNWLLCEGIPVDRIGPIFANTVVCSGISGIFMIVLACYAACYFSGIEGFVYIVIFSTGIGSSVVVCTIIVLNWDVITNLWYENKPQFYERFARGALVASASILVSNSYIIEEGAGLSFLALSVLGVMALDIGTIRALMAWAACGVVLAMTRNYRGCREEQGDCWTSGGNMPTGQTSRVALVLALGSTSAVVAATRRYIGWRGYGVVLGGVFTCAHWAVGWGSLGSPSRSRLLARGAWVSIAIMFILVWRRENRGASLPIIICGLVIYLANALVLGATYAPSAALALLLGYLALNVVTQMKADGSSKYSLTKRCNSSVACVWALLASYLFYGTGHHATLGHIRWFPVFHAGDPNYLTVGPVISAFLLWLHLFGMPFLFGATVPLLAIWGRGSATLSPRSQLSAIFILCLKFGLCFAIRLFACMLSATIHCRHLMIWGVFTPKLLFEAGACTSALFGAILGSTLATWHVSITPRPS